MINKYLKIGSMIRYLDRDWTITDLKRGRYYMKALTGSPIPIQSVSWLFIMERIQNGMIKIIS